MMNKWNLRKPWCRMLSVMMALALTVTLLSGCGTSDSTTGEAVATEQEALPQEVQEEVRSKSSGLADASEMLEDTMEQLGKAVKEHSFSEAEEAAGILEEQLASLEEQTSDWFTAQENAGKNLSEEAQEMIETRNREFEQQLAANREQVQQALGSLQEALAEGNTEQAAEQTEALKELLVEETEPETYGEGLPGEAEVYEPEEKEAAGEEAEGTAREPEPLTEEELSALLDTKDDTELNDELKAKTEELGTPLAVYNYLKNNIGYEYYYGSRKGAAGTYAALAGNDMDQASLLIAMLRYLGYEAEYVRGNIYLTEEQAAALTGADNITDAAGVLAAAGTPVTRLTVNGETVKLSMEHVWVRAHIPYTDYRGAGNAGGRRVWIDLDTGIKAYEEVDNLYDAIEEEGIREEMEEMFQSGGISDMESLSEQWEEEIASMDTENLYARKRIIKREELSYLPLSLQYEVAEETETFIQTASEDQDRVSFSVAGQSLGTYTSAELAGKDILLSFRPASDVDEEILNGYGSIFDVPAHSVYLKPVLLVDGETAAEGEDTGTPPGTSQTFTMTLHSCGKDTVVENAVTTGSMYAVTLDNQSITGTELQNVYDETAALKDSVTEENVYSEAYLGKLLALAGKLYFAQVDAADMTAAEMYDVSQTRSLSEGITGYEVRTTSLYGMVTGISEGSLYIDVDTDSRSVVSLKGDKDVTREYMFSTGMISSLYESTVWEELTGYESVSTISILAKAQEEDIDILLISKDNLSTELEKLNTDETTRETVINAVNSGKIVTIPAEDVTMGEWSGIGYIITNPETGAGAYMISGGLNGGSVVVPASLTYMMGLIYTIYMLSGLLSGVIGIVCLLLWGSPVAAIAAVLLLALTCIAMIFVTKQYSDWTMQYMDLLLDGDVAAAYDMMYGISVEYFSELLQYERVLTKEEEELVTAIRNEIGTVPEEGTKMVKVIPQAEIDTYLKGDYTSVRGFVSEAEFSEKLRTLEEVYEGNRLDYANTAFSLSDDTYGKITYSYNCKTEIEIPRYEATNANYPYTGRGFTASKNVILPEWQQIEQNFVEDDLLEVFDSKTGDIISTYRFKGGMWVEQ